MRNYIILNGVNSNTITGLLISTLPPITKPKIRTQVEEIDGRDGDIVTKLGYSAYEKEFQIGLYGDFDINEVIAYFNTEGDVVFSNEPDKYYKYQILDQIDYEKLIRFKTASVKMHVQPFKYPTEEEQIQVDATVVTGEGSNITLEYTNADHIITSELKGDLYQKTTTGKNLATDFSNIWYNSNTQKFTTNTSFVSCIAKVEPNTTYTISKKNISNRFVVITSEIKPVNDATYKRVIISENQSNTRTKYTFTTQENENYIFYGFYNGTSESEIINAEEEIMIEEGSEATDYEEYTGGIPAPSPDYPEEIQVVTGNQSISIRGKNLFNISDPNVTKNSVTIAVSDNTLTQTNTGTYCRTAWKIENLKVGETYKLSYNFSNPSGSSIAGRLFDSNNNTQVNGTATTTDTSGTQTLTFTPSESTRYLRLYSNTTSTRNTYTVTYSNIQIEEGSETTDYQPYQSQNYTINLGSTELCKIGDYQDKIYQEDGTWYLEKKIGKVVLNGSETMSITNSGTANWFYNITKNTGINEDSAPSRNNAICNFYTIASVGAGNTNEGIYILKSGYIRIRYGTEDTVANFKTWLGNNNVIVYYVLATPTTTEITDAGLLAQLNALAGATTYDNQTNITVSGSLPAILSVSTQGMPNTVINNIGNIYAKPLITIYGSGDIGVYLNQQHVLQIALGDSGSITIDVSKMEAYDKNTQVLMNRLVTGDYMKFLINSGENNISFSGNVAGFTMDNYTRWL